MNERKFFICKHCGNIISFVESSGVPVVCCGEKMTEITANTVDASREKHLPVVTRKGSVVTVNVGSVAHPMQPEHSIQWAYLVTDKGYQLKHFTVGNEPVISFAITDDEKPEAVYAYCNLHGLWKTEL